MCCENSQSQIYLPVSIPASRKKKRLLKYVILAYVYNEFVLL